MCFGEGFEKNIGMFIWYWWFVDIRVLFFILIRESELEFDFLDWVFE